MTVIQTSCTSVSASRDSCLVLALPVLLCLSREVLLQVKAVQCGGSHFLCMLQVSMTQQSLSTVQSGRQARKQLAQARLTEHSNGRSVPKGRPQIRWKNLQKTWVTLSVPSAALIDATAKKAAEMPCCKKSIHGEVACQAR